MKIFLTTTCLLAAILIALPVAAKEKKRNEVAAVALTNFPAAFAAPADEPYLLENQAYRTSTLFTTKSVTRDGMGACEPKVFKGNAYAIYMRHGDEVIMVAKVPLNGSTAVTLPLGTVNKDSTKLKSAPSDNHCVYIIDVDRAGYIHVCGGMHSSRINYWRSDKPEDISSFTRIMPDDTLPPDTQPCPIAGSITFPRFFSDRHGKLFWTAVQGCGPLCSYDETTKLWTALGDQLGELARKPRKQGDQISFYYTDKSKHATTDTTKVKGGLSQKGFSVTWDSKDRMHMLIVLLNRNTYIGDHKSAHTVLYAYSDDGGKTVYQSNGERIQLPISPDAGPHQGEVMISDSDGDSHIAMDKADRPIIWCYSGKTGQHCFRLESGRWVDYHVAPVGGDLSTDPSGVLICKHHKHDNDYGFTRFWNPDGRNSQTIDLPVKVKGYDQEYYRDTGELVWTSDYALHGKTKSANYAIHRTVFDRMKK